MVCAEVNQFSDGDASLWQESKLSKLLSEVFRDVQSRGNCLYWYQWDMIARGS